MEQETDTRSRRHDRNLATILDAARALVMERGPESLSLREVARRADYSPAALYRYFTGKDELVAALGMDATRALGTYIERVPADTPPAEQLVALGEAYVRFAEESPEQFTLFERLRLPQSDWERYVTIAWPFTVIVESVRAGMDAGALASGDPASAALGLWALAHGFASLRAGHLHDVTAQHAAMQHDAFVTHVRGLMEGAGR